MGFTTNTAIILYVIGLVAFLSWSNIRENAQFKREALAEAAKHRHTWDALKVEQHKPHLTKLRAVCIIQSKDSRAHLRLVEALAFGRTVIHYRCACGEIKTETANGLITLADLKAKRDAA